MGQLMLIQLDLFKSDEECRLDAIERRLDEINKSAHKVRKGTFAKTSDHEKRILDMDERLKIIERNICK